MIKLSKYIIVSCSLWYLNLNATSPPKLNYIMFIDFFRAYYCINRNSFMARDFKKALVFSIFSKQNSRFYRVVIFLKQDARISDEPP